MKLFKEFSGRERSITVEQAATLLGELPEHQRDVVVFALATGLRQSNALGLEWSHVDLEARHAWVGASDSKNDKPISVPLNATAMEVLRRQLGKHPQRVFTYAGKPLANANTRAWRKALKRAGIENFRWHDTARLGLVASPVGDTDARAATPRWLAFFGDGRTLRASRARSSRERCEPARFAVQWLRFSYVRNEEGISRKR